MMWKRSKTSLLSKNLVWKGNGDGHGRCFLFGSQGFRKSRSWMMERNFSFETSRNASSRVGLWFFGGVVLGLGGLYLENKFSIIEGYTSTKKRDNKIPPEVIQQLKEVLGQRISLDHQTTQSFGKDNSYHEATPPDVVVFPTNTEEIQKIVSICNKYKVPIIPFGSGTSLEGHISAIHGGVCIAFNHMKKLLAINVDDADAIVQPGITYDELNEQLKKYDLFFSPDPGPGASIGGMVGTSCSGPSAVKYGTMKENILNLTVVLPNGKKVKTGQRSRKSSAGYDLTHLFVGAEGTLGVVTEITVKLHHIPPHKAVALCQFPTVEDASLVVQDLFKQGISIGKVELLDEVAIKSVNQYADLSYQEMPTLLFEFSGSESQVKEQGPMLQQISNSRNGIGFRFAVDAEERQKLWSARKEALWAAPVLRPGSEVKITDVCVPISNLAKCIKETKDDLVKSSFIAPLVGHVGDGNFHLFILVDTSNQSELKELEKFDHRLVQRAIKMEGTCTGEHGVGIGKKDYLFDELGVEAVDLMRTIKNAVDPNNIMNPGKVIPDKKEKY